MLSNLRSNSSTKRESFVRHFKSHHFSLSLTLSPSRTSNSRLQDSRCNSRSFFSSSCLALTIVGDIRPLCFHCFHATIDLHTHTETLDVWPVAIRIRLSNGQPNLVSILAHTFTPLAISLYQNFSLCTPSTFLLRCFSRCFSREHFSFPNAIPLGSFVRQLSSKSCRY